TYDLDYLRGNIFGGEGYDWYYASAADRLSQSRTPVTDGGGKPWLYRFKDVRAWWSSAHHNRVAGVDAATPTAWVAQSKPIWFTELGCPAV
ncbi:baseplate megatron protein TIM-barrel domain-containing protein, partial [Vibrio parahaemolyticus]